MIYLLAALQGIVSGLICGWLSGSQSNAVIIAVIVYEVRLLSYQLRGAK